LFGKKINFLGSISNRDKLLIFVTAFFLILFLLYQFVALPLSEKKRELQIQEETYMKELERLREIGKEYVEYKNKYLALTEMIEKKRNSSVLTYLDNMSQSLGIRDNIDYIRPNGTIEDDDLIKNIVEIKIDAIVVDDLVKFMNKIENQRPGLLIYSIRLKPFFKDRSKTDATIKIIDINLKENMGL